MQSCEKSGLAHKWFQPTYLFFIDFIFPVATNVSVIKEEFHRILGSLHGLEIDIINDLK